MKALGKRKGGGGESAEAEREIGEGTARRLGRERKGR